MAGTMFSVRDELSGSTTTKATASRYQRRTGFVFKEDSVTKSLLRVPKHPKCLYPNGYFQRNVFATANEIGSCGTYVNESQEEFPAILAGALKAETK